MCGLYKNLKWLGSNPSVELLTPNPYLIDFIELSGIKQEEAINSLNEKYEKYGLTLRELAAGSVHSRDTISRRLKEVGSRMRSPGVRKRDYDSVNIYSKKELGELVKAKRGAGLTYREIAGHLVSKKISHSSEFINWHPMMIKRIADNTSTGV